MKTCCTSACFLCLFEDRGKGGCRKSKCAAMAGHPGDCISTRQGLRLMFGQLAKDARALIGKVLRG